MDETAFLQAARDLASDRTRVIVTEHARKRDAAKGKHPISDRAIVNCIKAASASVTECPAPDIKEAGGWKAKITSTEPGKVTEVSCVVVPETKIVIVTAYETRTFARAPRPPPGSPDTGDDTFEEGNGDGQV